MSATARARNKVDGRGWIASLLGAGLMSAALLAHSGIPPLPDLPGEILRRYRDPLLPDREELAKQRQVLVDEGRSLNSDCKDVDKGSAKHQDCLRRANQFNSKSEALRPKMEALDDAICVAKVLSEICAYDLPKEPANPDGLPAHILKRVKPDYQTLHPVWEKVRQETISLCTSPPSTFSKPGQGCSALKAGFISERFNYQPKAKAYAASVEKVRKMFPLPRYQEYNHGLVLGLTAIGGFNVPRGSSSVVREHAAKSFHQQQPSETPAVSSSGYDFVLGIAKSILLDRELWRALRDNSLQGAYSAYEREIYPSLKGRSFDLLECHSNGAMVCLAALGNGDLAAREVRLFGPQITASSLAAWSKLVTDGYIEEVTIYWLNGDPIPLISLEVGQALYIPIDWPVRSDSASAALQQLVASYPSIGLRIFDCPMTAELDHDRFACHRVQLYQQASQGKLLAS
jgi:hypothetical protein